MTVIRIMTCIDTSVWTEVGCEVLWIIVTVKICNLIYRMRLVWPKSPAPSAAVIASGLAFCGPYLDSNV